MNNALDPDVLELIKKLAKQIFIKTSISMPNNNENNYLELVRNKLGNQYNEIKAKEENNKSNISYRNKEFIQELIAQKPMQLFSCTLSSISNNSNGSSSGKNHFSSLNNTTNDKDNVKQFKIIQYYSNSFNSNQSITPKYNIGDNNIVAICFSKQFEIEWEVLEEQNIKNHYITKNDDSEQGDIETIIIKIERNEDLSNFLLKLIPKYQNIQIGEPITIQK